MLYRVSSSRFTRLHKAVLFALAVLLLFLFIALGYRSTDTPPLPVALPTPLPALPPPPPLYTLTATDLARLDEPWRWFESSGEHRDLVRKVQALRQAKGAPLVIIDVGLNIGSAPWAIAQVCPDCIVYGFEPVPRYFAYAQYKLPKFPNIHLHNYALCDHTGPESIWMETASNIGWNTLIGDEKSPTQVQVPIVCVTLDRFWSTLPQPRSLDLIKIDTEGAEHMVLRGMQETIRSLPSPKPWIYVEIGWGRGRKDWADELAAFRFLFDNGYEAYDLDAITGTSMHWITPRGAADASIGKSERQLK